MHRRLTTTDQDFEQAFAALLAHGRDDQTDVEAAVAEIVKDVRTGGDAALIRYTARFDRLALTPETLAVSEAERVAAWQGLAPVDRAALEHAAERIRAYHARQMPENARWTDAGGAELGWRWTPVAAAGLYVPGGLASYPSSVLMNAIPAAVAGVPRIAIAVPAPEGVLNPMVLAAAHLAGVTEIWRIGGAQAVAALAYGTETIRPVAKITGPGNAYVAAAKRQVFGHVGIDMIAGPSEVLVIADASADPDWLAADLLAQAEHDTSAQALLMTDDAAVAEAVPWAIERELASLPRRDIASASWRDNGAVIRVRDLEEAAALTDRIAPEHLELAVRDPDALAARIRNAGAIFLGAGTPEAIGDYVAGPNHVLPTARSARFSSGLSVLDFMKRTTLARMSPASLRESGPVAIRLAEIEGLDGHARSVARRLAGAAE
ncbi:MAG: histidinol dehydrogenase [Pseudomonadota bacterium]